MENIELINKLESIKNEINFQVRITQNGKKKEINDAYEELKNLSDQAIIIYKEHNILDLTHPNRNKENDYAWFKELYGKGGAHDINMAILHLKEKLK